MAPVLPLPTLLAHRQHCQSPDGRLALTSTGHARHAQQGETLVRALRLQKRLERHTGCVNTVAWSDDGSLLVSGSDDCDLNIWRTEQDLMLVHNITSGHTGNIFCAKFVPCVNNALIVSCALDGNVRLTDVHRGTIHCMARYAQRVHKVAFLPQSPTVFLTAGSDGTVRLFDLRCDSARQVKRADTSNIVFDLRAQQRGNSIDVSALSIHPLHGHLLTFGGGDEFVRVADLRRPGSASPVGSTCVARFCPDHLTSGRWTTAYSPPHITGCQYDVLGQRIVATYSGDDIFIFDTSGIHPALPLNRGQAMAEVSPRPGMKRAWGEDEPEEELPHYPVPLWFCDVSREKDPSVGDNFGDRRTEGPVASPVLQRLTGHRNEDTVKEVTFYGVDSEFVASGSDCGNIFIWASHSGRLVNILKDADSRTINCIAANPHDMTVVATCGIDDDIKVWKPDGQREKAPDEAEMRDMAASNSQRRHASPRISARQVLQLFLSRGALGRDFLRVLTGEALGDSAAADGDEDIVVMDDDDDDEEAEEDDEEGEEEEGEEDTTDVDDVLSGNSEPAEPTGQSG